MSMLHIMWVAFVFGSAALGVTLTLFTVVTFLGHIISYVFTHRHTSL